MVLDPRSPQPWLLGDGGSGARKHAPATARNSSAIGALLQEVLPVEGKVLEIASGSGEHAIYLAAMFPRLTWQPSDADPDALASIDAWRREAGLANVLAPLRIDAAAPDWPIDQADALVCINMIHISPWAASEGLIAGAQRLLAPGAPLYLYGPFHEAGIATAASNVAFDASLKSRNRDWGLRAVEDVIALARSHGFGHHRIVRMPANNLSVILRR